VAAAAVIVAVVLLNGHTLVPQGGGTGTAKNTTSSQNAPAAVQALNNQTPAVPAGWTTETVLPSLNGTTAGFSIGLPPSWTIQQNRLATDLYAPDGIKYMDVDLTPHQYPNNMVAEANYIEVNALKEGHLPGYQLIALERESIRGTAGAYWAFTWNADGVTMRVDDLLFVLDGQSYALYFTAPVSQFSSSEGLPQFEQMLSTFQPVTG
jgi:hypothetical protein